MGQAERPYGPSTAICRRFRHDTERSERLFELYRQMAGQQDGLTPSG